MAFVIQSTDPWDLFFVVMLGLTVLVMLYTMSLINGRVRVLESEMQSTLKELTVLSEELEMVASIQGASETENPPAGESV